LNGKLYESIKDINLKIDTKQPMSTGIEPA
jgi:hypothetical protein